MAARLLVVEDHPLFRDGFAAMVRMLRPDWQLDAADSAAAALALLERLDERIDLAIVDVGLPDQSGLTLADTIARLYPAVPVVLMSGRTDPMLMVQAQRSSALGLIGKSEPAHDIAAAIDAVLAGQRRFSAGDVVVECPTLTPRQVEVLALLAEGFGNKQIRFRLGIAERTVRAHLTELFAALGAHSRTQALIRARALGLIA